MLLPYPKDHIAMVINNSAQSFLKLMSVFVLGRLAVSAAVHSVHLYAVHNLGYTAS